MTHSGDWVTPRLNGLKYFEKPPLQYWATAAAYSVFGVGEWTARLWSCALAFLCIPLAYARSRAISTAMARRRSRAAAVLAVNPYSRSSVRLNILDKRLLFLHGARRCVLVHAGAHVRAASRARAWVDGCGVGVALRWPC